MGFEIGGNNAVLEFGADTGLAGAVVQVSLDMSVRDFLALQRAIAGMSSDASGLDESMLDRWEKAYTMFGATSLKSWNLELAGQPVPATADGFLSLPFASANTIFTAWARALASPSPNSPAASVNGALSEAELAEMVR